MQSSSVFNLGDYGLLHTGSLPDPAVAMLHAHCESTPPDAVAFAHDLFDDATMKVIHQAHYDEAPLRCLKLPNGFVVVTPSNKIVSVISDSRLCKTAKAAEPAVHVTVNHHNSPSYFFSHVQDPSAPPVKPMYLVSHSRVTSPNEVSRYSPVNSFAAKYTAHIPLEGIPRVMMASHTMGKAEGRLVAGKEADFIKQVVLSAMSQGDPFHRPIAISDAVGSAMMINNTSKPIFCMRINDGVVGYRARNDGKHSFVFAAHSADMNRDRPTPGCPLKVVKVSYNTDTLAAPRLMVHPTDGDVTSNMSFQDVLNKLSHKFEETNIQAMGCNGFEKLCVAATENPHVWTQQAAASMVRF
jgi:hypothetical protein